MGSSVFSRVLLCSLAVALVAASPSLADEKDGKPDPKSPVIVPYAPRMEMAQREVAEDEGDGQVDLAVEAEQYTVKVLNASSNLFLPDIERSHGTGFIVSLSEKEGLIFTNRHVVEIGPLDAQKIVLQFATAQGNPEAIEGQVAYVSPLMDFAVVRFDPRKLKRSKANLTTAPIAAPQEFDKIVRKGAGVMAFGHPMDTRNVATFGVVSGFHVDHERGTFIQTSAAINPGNSGGPLIAIHSHKVIGINSAKIMGADNTGYVIPINQVLYDFMTWKKDRDLRFSRTLMARYAFYSANKLKIEKLEKVVTDVVPGFFDEHEGLIMVTEAAASSTLQTGDLILSVNGTVFGLLSHVLDRIVHEAKESVDAVVIRNGKVVPLKIPVVSQKISELRRQVDFVLVSGLLFVESNPDVAWAVTNEKTRVRVGMVLPFTPAAELGTIPPGSAISGLQIDGVTYPVKRLSDIKQALKKRTNDDAVRFVFHPPAIAEGEDGRGHLLRDHQFDSPLVMRATHVELMPIDAVITPAELRIRDMKKSFDFMGSKPANRDWRTFVKQPGEVHACRGDLEDMGEDALQTLVSAHD